MTFRRLRVFVTTSLGKNLLVGAVLIATWLASSWALLHPGFFRVHDYVHAARIAEMTRALQEGHFPVRWSGNFGYGYGMPLFEFYAPLPFYVGSALYWLGVPMVVVLKILWAGCSLLTAWGGYRLGKILFGKSGGLVLAAALTLAPYRAVNLFVRGSLSEAWGIMAMPWILYGGVGVLKGRAWGWWVLVLGLVTLMLSHNLTTLMFVPVSGLLLVMYGGVQWWRGRAQQRSQVLKRGLVLVGSYLLAVGLSSFYLFPALVEKDFTQIDSILSGYFHYSQHFLYVRQLIKPFWGYGGSEWGPNDGISFFLGYGQWLGLGAATGLLVWKIKTVWQNRAEKSLAGLWQYLGWYGVLGVTLVGAVFMSLQRSQSVWDAVPLLSFIQFPWRWLSVVIMVLSLLIAWSLTLITDQRRRWQYVLGLVAIILIGNAFYFRPQSYLVNADDYYYTDASRIRTQMSGILPDYIPKQMSEDLTPPEALFLVPAGIEEQVEVLVDRGHERLLKTSLLSPIKLHFTIADFPGWQVEIDGQPVEKRGGENGGIAVEVPAGEHLIGAYFGATPVRYWSDVISGLSLVVLLLVAVRLQSDLPSHLVPEPISTKPTTRPTPARTKKRKPSS